MTVQTFLRDTHRPSDEPAVSQSSIPYLRSSHASASVSQLKLRRKQAGEFGGALRGPKQLEHGGKMLTSQAVFVRGAGVVSKLVVRAFKRKMSEVTQ